MWYPLLRLAFPPALAEMLLLATPVTTRGSETYFHCCGFFPVLRELCLLAPQHPVVPGLPDMRCEVCGTFETIAWHVLPDPPTPIPASRAHSLRLSVPASLKYARSSCLNNVILAKGPLLRSGWKTVLTVLRSAARDPQEEVRHGSQGRQPLGGVGLWFLRRVGFATYRLRRAACAGREFFGVGVVWSGVGGTRHRVGLKALVRIDPPPVLTFEPV